MGLLVFIGAGSYIHYNTRVLNEYVIQDDREALQADYEKQYVQYKEAELPTITKTFAKIDMFP